MQVEREELEPFILMISLHEEFIHTRSYECPHGDRTSDTCITMQTH